MADLLASGGDKITVWKVTIIIQFCAGQLWTSCIGKESLTNSASPKT